MFSSFHEKQRAFEYIETGKEDLRKLSPANPSEFEAGVREWMTAYCEMNDYRKTGGGAAAEIDDTGRHLH